jgi:hypothetical protein
MGRARTFGEVLEHEMELGAYRPARRAAKAPQPARLTPPHPFLFVDPRFFFNATAYASMPGAAGGSVGSEQATHAGASVPAPHFFGPSRPLAARQERALGELVGLGANLRADFTAAELRSAFRALARRYHPDGHPGSSPAMKVRLSRLFAALTENYRCLMALIEPTGGIRH